MKALISLLLLLFSAKLIIATAYIRVTPEISTVEKKVIKKLLDNTQIKKIKIVRPAEAKFNPIPDFPQVEILYKIEFYNYLENKLSSHSRAVFFIMNKGGSIIYESPIDKIDYLQVNYFTHYEHQTLIGSEIFRLNAIQYCRFQNDKSLVVSDKNDAYIADMKTEGLTPLKVSERLRAAMYKEFLRDDFDKRYSGLMSYLEGQNSKGYAAKDAYFVNDNELIVFYRVTNWLRKNGNDIFSGPIIYW